MRPLRYSINLTLDGCCDHEAGQASEELHRHTTAYIGQADALLFGRVTFELMQAGWQSSGSSDERPEWMQPFAQTISAAKKYVVSSTLPQVDWNAEFLHGDLDTAVR